MIRVGVLRGGVSPEYDISLLVGGRVLSSLNTQKFTPVDLLITKDGEWHMNGLPVSPDKLKLSVDIIWNALHGHFGEDGKVQQFLDSIDIPYVGSGAFASAVCHNKMLCRDRIKDLGYLVPKSRVIKYVDEDIVSLLAKDIFMTIPPPWVVKPLSGGSSVDTYIARSYDELVGAIYEMKDKYDEILIEEYIYGQELWSGVVDNFRNEECYSFPTHCISTDNGMLCTHQRLSGDYSFYIPKDTPKEVRDEVESHARKIHKALGLNGYSSVDFIKNKKGLYVLEVDSQPAFHDHAPFSKALDAMGVTFTHFLESLIENSMHKK
jgi:D-alanine-D-alanine ligase